ncbi:MAG: DNA primase [Candidatus Aenigmarchaeota archaeon]|nr:DNA primase [Candidatus Aenigmarchaeota archaeon]
MGKLAQSTIKYLIEANFTANGIVEKPDIIGAIFGQTEGLLGQDLDLRELQRTGRIGRIEVNVKEERGKTKGVILIPSSLDASETVLIAAAIETIERIGPCDSEIRVKSVKDIRSLKRDYVVKRAKEILEKMLDEELPETSELAEKIKTSVRAAEITSYEGLPAGPDVTRSDEVIFVEGRADVLKLLKNGIKNVIAIGGATALPEPIIKLSKEKTVTVFLDGDRGGELILKELLHMANIDFIARAPEGKEVEELTKKEIFKALRDKISTEEYIQTSKFKSRRKKTIKEEKIMEREEYLDEKTRKKINEILDKMVGTKAAYIFNNSMKLKSKIPLNKFEEKNKALKDAEIVLVDETINDNIVDIAEQANVKYLIADKSKKKYKDRHVNVLTRKDLQ